MTRYFTRIAAAALLAVIGGARPASAQVRPAGLPPIDDTGGTNKPGFGDIPQPKLGGFTMDLSFSDSTALNAENYSNGLGLTLSPAWAVGSKFLKNTPFKALNISGRFSIGRSLAGYDPTGVTPDNGIAPLGTCSDVKTNTNGTVDPNSINRCQLPANNYRFEPSDLLITVSNPGIYKIPVADVRINPSVRLTVPFSYTSRYATLQAALQAAVGASRTFLDNKLSVSYSFSFSKNFHKYATPTLQTRSPEGNGGLISPGYDAASVASNDVAFYANASATSPAGGFNTSYGFSNVFNVGYQILPKLGVSATYVIGSSFSYAGACATGTYGGVTTNPCDNADKVAQSSSINSSYSQASRAGWREGTAGINIRDSQTFVFGASYDATNWASVYLQWVNSSPLRAPNNTLYQPFISTNYNAFTSVSLGASFSLGNPDAD